MVLKDKVALVTGGSRGIGSAISIGLAKEGARVAVNYISNKNAAIRTVDEIIKQGGLAYAIQADIASRYEVQKMIDEIVSKFGGIDILVNNAAVVYGDLMLEMSDENWDRQFKVNIYGYFYCTQIAVKRMIQQGRGGRIINISSINSYMAINNRSAYSATKGAIDSFSRCCALELAQYGINVNVVAPGATYTEINESLWSEQDVKVMMERIALKRIAQPEDIVGAVLFFASHLSNYITGQSLVVDGGWTVTDRLAAVDLIGLKKG